MGSDVSAFQDYMNSSFALSVQFVSQAAFNYMTGQMCTVPVVDMVFAGFVCKSARPSSTHLKHIVHSYIQWPLTVQRDSMLVLCLAHVSSGFNGKHWKERLPRLHQWTTWFDWRNIPRRCILIQNRTFVLMYRAISSFQFPSHCHVITFCLRWFLVRQVLMSFWSSTTSRSPKTPLCKTTWPWVHPCHAGNVLHCVQQAFDCNLWKRSGACTPEQRFRTCGPWCRWTGLQFRAKCIV